MRVEVYATNKLSAVLQQGETPKQFAQRKSANMYWADTQADTCVLVYFMPPFDPNVEGFEELLDFRIDEATGKLESPELEALIGQRSVQVADAWQ